MERSKALTELAGLYRRTNDELQRNVKTYAQLNGAHASAENFAKSMSIVCAVEREKAWLNGVNAALKAAGISQLRDRDGTIVYGNR